MSFVSVYALSQIKGLGNKALLGIIKKNELPQCCTDLFKVVQKAARLNKRIQLPKFEDFEVMYQKAKAEFNTCQEQDITCLTYNDDIYPEAFKDQDEAPALLFCKGDLDLLTEMKGVAIIGTRKPTDGTISALRDSTTIYAEKGRTIVSGLAEGCDSIGHGACLRANGRTIAVLGCGLDKIARKSKDLADHIVSQDGLLVTEYPLGTTAAAYRLVSRNRLIVYFSDMVLVGQCSAKSGTMDCIEKAFNLDRDLLVLAPQDGEKFEGNRIAISKFNALPY